MVTLAIGAVALGLALPSLHESLVQAQLGSAARELVASVRFARSEAVRLGQPVMLRKKGSAETGGWENGWTIAADVDGNGVLDAGDQIIREVAPMAAPLTITGNASLRQVLVFDRDGRPVGASGGMFLLCHGPSLSESRSPRFRAVHLNGAGHVRVADDGDLAAWQDNGPPSSCANP